ncbi:MAG TPA: hypothetical protein VIT43_04715 [Candidatus Dormibacteraeota bacterium]
MPLMKREAAERLSDVIRELAEQVAAIGRLQAQGAVKAHAHPELQQVTAAFERINQTLKTAVDGGAMKPEQQRAIAEQFEAIARALEKGAP